MLRKYCYIQIYDVKLVTLAGRVGYQMKLVEIYSWDILFSDDDGNNCENIVQGSCLFKLKVKLIMDKLSLTFYEALLTFLLWSTIKTARDIEQVLFVFLG